MANETILVVEDEKPIVKLLKYNLEKEGFHVLTADNGESGLAAFNTQSPELVILDVMLPRLDGFEFCKIVRRQSKTPILMLTAKKQEVDRILGLELGADDYVVKPFSVREVIVRVKGILRRAYGDVDSAVVLRAGTLEMDTEKYETRLGEEILTLTTKEFEFLKILLQARGKAMTRDQLLEKVWGYDQSMEIDTRTVDQHVKRLREKLGREASRLLTVKNVGYRLKLD